ncbi:hypothetical protein [Fulvivirga sp.]|uniref:hypothetical protein n=1 Tax=Fulvivirga sp. TaxID=1931237 RepID=UPI0032EB3028
MKPTRIIFILIFLLCYSKSFSQQVFNEDVGVKIEGSTPQAPLHVRQGGALGQTLNHSQLIMRLQAESSNNFYQSIWIRRDETGGGDWKTTRLHNGISIDGSYLSPGVNTRTWWERDPKDNIQSWGNGAHTYMVLQGPSLTLGSESGAYGRFQVNQQDDAADKGIAVLNSTGQRAMRLWTDANNSYVYSGATGASDLILNGQGKVGIGTNSPSAHLDIKADIQNRDFLRFSSDRSWVMRLVGDGGSDSHLGLKALHGDKYFKIQDHLDNSVFTVRTGNGRVGIGVEQAAYKLDVNGTIHASEVLVDLNFPGPDYVFEQDYPLSSLSEIESYIKANKHLPEVPSAAQMKEDGVNVIEMQMLLLKKVEELTLLLIKESNENKELGKKLKQVEAELKDLKSKL